MKLRELTVLLLLGFVILTGCNNDDDGTATVSLRDRSVVYEEDLAEIEASEIKALEEFLPQQLSEEEIIALIDSAIADTNAAGMQDMGKVMGILSKDLAGKADGKTISMYVKKHLMN